MKKRKVLALLLALTMLVALLAGCAGKEEEAPASEAPASEAPASEAPAPESDAPEAPAEGEPAEDGEEGQGGHGELVIAGTYNADGSYTSEGGITYPLGELGKKGEDSEYHLTFFCPH